MSVVEEDIGLVVRTLPCGTRDFIFVRPVDKEGDGLEILHPMELLGLDLAAQLLERIKDDQPGLALVIALCRLLVPCLEYRGNRRHLIVEKWSDDDLRGGTIFQDTRTQFANELGDVQSDEYQVVTEGTTPPEGTLAEIFWDAHTSLPDLPDVFEDAHLSNFAKVLYLDLAGEGEGFVELSVSRIRSRILALWRENFVSLDVTAPNRYRRPVFKKLMAATIRMGSQFNGMVARTLVIKRLGASARDTSTFTDEEESLLELRYGGSRALRDINIGLLFGCGPLFADLVNDFAAAHLAGASADDLDESRENLRDFIYLLGQFRKRRKTARAEEKRSKREAYADAPPSGERRDPEREEDERAPQPAEQAVVNEELEMLRDLLPQLKPRDATRLQALLDANGDRGVAADSLEIDQVTFSRQWRQTTLKNIRKLIRQTRDE